MVRGRQSTRKPLIDCILMLGTTFGDWSQWCQCVLLFNIMNSEKFFHKCATTVPQVHIGRQHCHIFFLGVPGAEITLCLFVGRARWRVATVQ